MTSDSFVSDLCFACGSGRKKRRAGAKVTYSKQWRYVAISTTQSEDAVEARE